MRKLVFSSAVIIGVALSGTALAALHTYKTESAAQKHCPRDIVVWDNTASGVYNMKGSKNYGTTKDGRYVCKQEADAAGLKPAANNQ